MVDDKTISSFIQPSIQQHEVSQFTIIKLAVMCNFLLWSKAVEKFLSAKDKLDYIYDDLPDINPSWKWRKENDQFMPKKGGTPHRNEIVFISPTGEEVKNKRQLDIYLRSHPGNPSSSEFDWGTGDTPRRSARISEKAKATETPEGEKPKKRERKSSSKKGGNKNKDSDAVNEASATEEDATVEDTRAFDEKMQEAEGGEDKSKEEVVSVETAVKEEAVGRAPLDEVKENVEEKTELEESSKVDPPAAVPEEGEKEEKPETEKPADDEILPPATDKKEEASAETGIDSKVPENGTRKENEASVPRDAPSVNCDDGQHQPQASPVNC